MGGKLTTHVLDTSIGEPANGLGIELYQYTPAYDYYEFITEAWTNEDGRLHAPLLEGDGLEKGVYELRFDVGSYFAAKGSSLGSPAFLTIVPVFFGVSDNEAHYHVPLLISPGGYSTYKGS